MNASSAKGLSAVSLRVRQLARYFGTAGIAALVDLGGFLAFLEVGLTIVFAATLSFLLATIVNYLLTARFVFGHEANFRGYGRFLLAALTGFALNVGATLLSSAVLGISPALAKVIGIATAFLVNFALNVIFVFPPRGSSSSDR